MRISGVPAATGVGVDAQADHRLAQGARAAAMGQGEGASRQFPEQRLRTDIGLAVPGAFLAAQGEGAERRGVVGVAAIPRQDHHSGGDPGKAVEVAAVRHRIQVRADRHRRVGPAILGQAHPQIAVGVDFAGQADFGGDAGGCLQGAGFARAEAFAGDAGSVVAEFGDFGKEALGQKGVGGRQGPVHAPTPPCSIDQATGSAEKASSILACAADRPPPARKAACSSAQSVTACRARDSAAKRAAVRG